MYHTISEMKNGQGPAPIKTPEGWLHLAHGVRNTAAGLRYVLYLFLTDLTDPRKTIARRRATSSPRSETSASEMSPMSFSATAGSHARTGRCLSIMPHPIPACTSRAVRSEAPRLCEEYACRRAAVRRQRAAAHRSHPGNRRLDSRKQPDATLPNH